jgi:ribosomal protein L35
MKNRKMNNPSKGERAANELLAKAVAAKRLSDAARRHLKMLKAEHKQARKAFKQAKKAAKQAVKAAKAAAKRWKPKESGKQKQKVKPTPHRIPKLQKPAAAPAKTTREAIPSPTDSVPTNIAAAAS